MATTKAILKQIKLNGVLKDLLAMTTGDLATVTYNGSEMTLTNALATILTSLTALPTGENVDEKISAAIDGLIDGAPETYDTLKEIATYISENDDAMTALNSAIGTKVDKVTGKGLSAEDFTTALKTKLESLPTITASDVADWNAKADTDLATTSTNGLMSATDKTRLDGLRGVYYGTEAPSDMEDGSLFVQVVSEE